MSPANFLLLVSPEPPAMRHPSTRLDLIPTGGALSRALLIAVATFSAQSAAAQGQSFTLESALSAPFPSELTAAPGGGGLAWVFDAQGSRNIWIAEPGANGAYSSRQLTSYTGDNGVEIGQLAWSYDGKALAFSRGGDPNPRDLPLGGTPSQLWAMAVGDTAPHLIGDGNSPT